MKFGAFDCAQIDVEKPCLVGGTAAGGKAGDA
jgi:hypothetical protein